MQMFCVRDAKHLHAKHMDDGNFFARDVRRCKTCADVLQQGYKTTACKCSATRCKSSARRATSSCARRCRCFGSVGAKHLHQWRRGTSHVDTRCKTWISDKYVFHADILHPLRRTFASSIPSLSHNCKPESTWRLWFHWVKFEAGCQKGYLGLFPS